MASFATTDAALYRYNPVASAQVGGAFFELVDVTTASGSLSDATADGVFQPGEPLTFTLSAPQVVSQGTFGGTTTMTFRDPTNSSNLIPRQCLVFQLDVPPGGDPQWILFPLEALPAGFQWPSGRPLRLSPTPFLVCFLAGTRIATPGGEVAVEALSPGDLVLTSDGRAVPAQRIGRQEVATAFVGHDAALPVEIAPGALAEGVPARPLRVTPDHGLLLDGVLVQAGALVNGTTIRRMTARELPQTFPVFHVETAEHVALLAEGAAAESYVANVPDSRMGWQGEAPATSADEMAAPRAMSARQVPRDILDAIAARVPPRAA